MHTKKIIFGRFLVHAWSLCEDLNEEHSISVHLGIRGHTHLACQ